jgi:F0F1-type ATP synthase assembly protein I
MLGRRRTDDVPGKLASLNKNLALSDIGMTIAFSVFIGFAVGLGLDKLLHTKPWLKLAGLLLGIVAGFVGLFREARAAGR